MAISSWIFLGVAIAFLICYTVVQVIKVRKAKKEKENKVINDTDNQQ